MTREEILTVAKPILLNTEMTRAILDNRKAVTRRPVKPQHLRVLDSPYHKNHPETPDKVLLERLCEPPYRPGNILYVRETWALVHDESGRESVRWRYKADDETSPIERWHPSIHMPKEAARIFLRVTDVRVERLQDMRLRHFLSEGVELLPGEYDTDFVDTAPRVHKYFKNLWDSTIKPADRSVYGWDANPWVWVIRFEKMEADK